MKTKILSGAITLAILLWTGSLYFSKTMLFITIGLGVAYLVISSIWFIYQTVNESLERKIRQKEFIRRWTK